MATLIRPELSTRNRYWISKHRHYELKHFCLQYKHWKKQYASINESVISSAFNSTGKSAGISDLTASRAIDKLYYSERINMVERAAMSADKELYPYILKAVTEGLSYTHLKAKMNIPCGRDMYYDRYRKFFWILSESRS